MSTWKFLILALAVCVSTQSFANDTIVNDVSLSDEQDGKNWLSYGRTYREQRFSPLDQISADSVKRLGIGSSH